MPVYKFIMFSIFYISFCKLYFIDGARAIKMNPLYVNIIGHRPWIKNTEIYIILQT